MDRFIAEKILENGLIAKITACIVIITLSFQLTQYVNCQTDSTQINLVLPVISSVLTGAMTFLFLKKDKNEK